ncbi:uncharacterized protein BYT42DRAFT_639026 [Radiomyces spectabilis]|uniref:uncharacterized protein n=1 Tax=Radiomyces spectabilis TaxID=64574 RepID=UPI002220D66B|nr:uncharacterized protein BYT42DRAFT_639026 [Radiomyces spectabilis]KAI8376572.1 hypothetical protein BYT42DRAFT_639026 [Radiomyces spectabilis]
MVKIINNYTDGLLSLLLSYHCSRNALRRSYPIQPKIYDVCRNGCKMYQAGEDSLACTHCQEPRFKADLCTPAMTMQQLSLKEQLALLISDD